MTLPKILLCACLWSLTLYAHALVIDLNETVAEDSEQSSKELALLKQASEELNQGNTEESRAIYKQFSTMNVKSAIPHLGIAKTYMVEKNHKAAERELKKAFKKAPNSSAVLTSLGRFHFLQGDTKSAEKYYLQAISVNTKATYPYLDLAQLYLNTGESKKSIQYFEKSIALNDKNSDAYYGLGLAYSEGNHKGPAVLAFKKAIELNPKNHLSYGALGKLFRQQGDTKQALNTFSEGISKSNNRFPLLIDRGDTYFRLKEVTKARADYQKASKSDPKSAAPVLRTAMLEEALGNNALAISQYKSALKLNENSATAYNNLAWLTLQTNGDTTSAQRWASKAVKLQPNNASFLDTLSWAQRANGKLDKAKSSLSKAIELQPNSTLYYHLGIVLEELGEHQKAKDAYSLALAKEGNSNERKDVQARLDRLNQIDNKSAAR